MNQIVLVGRLTKDPELRTTTTGKSFVNFSIAVNKRIKPTNPDDRDADFFNIKAWDKTADYVSNYLGKGRLVSIQGRMESRKYTDKEGVNREIWEVVADQVNGLDRPRDDAGGAPASAPAGGSRGNYSASPRTSAPPAEAEYDPFADD